MMRLWQSVLPQPRQDYYWKGCRKMEFYPIEMRCDYMKSEYAITDKYNPIFTWGAVNSEKGAYQKSFHIVL